MTIFWERFYSLCVESGVKPNAIRSDIGITSPGAMTYWKNKGTIPSGGTLIAIAAHFNTTVEYLLGESDDRRAPTPADTEKPPTPDGAEGGWSELQLRFVKVLASLPEQEQRELLHLAEYKISMRQQ